MKTIFILFLTLFAASCASSCRVCEIKILVVSLRPNCCSLTLERHLTSALLCYPCCAKKPIGKRSLGSENKVEVGFPCKFIYYDANEDGKIDLNEFVAATNLRAISKDVQKTFESANKNNSSDGIDCNEFKEAPFDFKCEPTCG